MSNRPISKRNLRENNVNRFRAEIQSIGILAFMQKYMSNFSCNLNQEQNRCLYDLVTRGYTELDEYDYNLYDDVLIVSINGQTVASIVLRDTMTERPYMLTGNHPFTDEEYKRYVDDFDVIGNYAHMMRHILPPEFQSQILTGGVQMETRKIMEALFRLHPEARELYPAYADPQEI